MGIYSQLSLIRISVTIREYSLLSLIRIRVRVMVRIREYSLLSLIRFRVRVMVRIREYSLIRIRVRDLGLRLRVET